MKRLLLSITLCSTIFLSSCDTLKQIGSVLIPSQAEMAGGLKDALTQGLFSGFDAFANPNSGNPLLRFALPGDAAKIEKTLRDIGMTSLVNEVTSKFTTAMTSAVVAAKPIFLNSVKQMTLTDAASLLLTDDLHAATSYFKTSMSPALMVAFRPIVDSTANLNGANKAWSNLANVYNKIPLIGNKVETSLTDFIAARAIDGMFTSVADEEEKIRTKYEFRKTDLMKKVFGYAEQEQKRKKTQS
jgi:hypothetical protein